MQKKKIQKIAGTVTTAIALLLVAFCAFLLFTKGANGATFIGKKAHIYIVSQSMEPKIKAGSFIVIEKADAKDVTLGDIITFKSSDPSIKGKLNTHQVVEIIGNDEKFITKGINNAERDFYPVDAKDIIGKYVQNATYINKFAAWFTTVKGLIITIAVGVTICLVVYVPDIVSAFKEDEKEKAKKELLQKELERLEEENKKASEE